MKAHYLKTNLIISIVLLAIEIFDVVWCFYLIEIIFRKRPPKKINDSKLDDTVVEDFKKSGFSSQLIDDEKFSEINDEQQDEKFGAVDDDKGELLNQGKEVIDEEVAELENLEEKNNNELVENKV